MKDAWKVDDDALVTRGRGADADRVRITKVTKTSIVTSHPRRGDERWTHRGLPWGLGDDSWGRHPRLVPFSAERWERAQEARRVQTEILRAREVIDEAERIARLSNPTGEERRFLRAIAQVPPPEADR